MADIRLISIIPPQTPIKGPAIPQGTSGSNSSPGLTSLDQGTTLSGFIINRDAGGNPILRTDKGDITFASNFFLKIGSEVTIRLDTGPGQSLAKILSVDGQPPEIAETTSAFAKQPEVVLTPHFRPPNALVSLNASVPPNIVAEPETANTITVFGTLIKPQQPATGSSEPPALPTGTQVALKIVAIESPATPASPQQGATTEPQTALPITSSYAAYARAAGTPPPPQTPAQPQTPTSPDAQTSASPQPTTPPAPATAAPATPATSLPQPPVLASPQATPLQTQVNAAITETYTPEMLHNVTVSAPKTPLPTTQPTQNQTFAQTPSQNNTPITTQNAPQTPPNAPTTLPSTPQSLPNIPALPQTATPLPTPPAAPLSQPLAPTTGSNFTGQLITSQVLGQEPTGEALLHTPLGVIRLQPETVLPTGSQLTLKVLQTTPPALFSLNFNITQGHTASTQPAPLLELAQQWSSLQQIFSLLSGRSLLGTPPQTDIPTASNQPTPSAKDIGPGLLVFITALRGGNFRSWLGKDNIKWLEDQGQGNLVKKAEGEFNSIATQYAETKPGQWQSLYFPVAVEGMLQQVRAFIKRDRNKQNTSGQETKSEDTRFVIELDLTQLGELQMDGFVRKQDNTLNFDMMIRTLTPLSPEIQQDILAIYNATGAITGYKGSLAFQSVREFPVNPMQDIIASHNITSA